MALNYRYWFEKHGALKHSSGTLDEEVWLDVGNSLEMGCFDHHQVHGYGSTLMALLENLEYLENLKKSAEAQKEIIVHLHEEPDMDCVSCWFVVKYFLEHTRQKFDALFGENGRARGLLSYVNNIDEGKGKVTDRPTLYALFSSLYINKEKSKETDTYVVEKGLELIALTIDLLSQKKDVDLSTYDFSELVSEEYTEEIRIIKNSVYEEEKKSNAISFEKISIWTKEGVLEEVPAAIWKELPRDQYGYNFARKEGTIVTIVPYSIKGKNGDETTRVFASINPDIDTEKKYSLKPIVQIIEQMEQMEEQRYYDQTGRYRRDHSKPRIDKSYLGEEPFSTTSDPWYFSPEEDLFDAPGAQSILDYEDIVEVIRSNGSTVKRSFVLSIGKDYKLNTIYEKKGIALSQWQRDVRNEINSDTDCKIVFAELDSSLIRRSNQILKAYCMNLIGKSFHESGESHFLCLDYRTCIYADINCVIILVATHGDNSYSALPAAGLLGIDTPEETLEKIRSSQLINNIEKVLKQRLELLDYGRKIGDLHIRKRKDIEKLNDNLLTFSARVQEENAIYNQLERQVYAFLKEEFEIDKLKSSVMDEISILVNESRDRLVSKFNVLSAFAVPFVLIATVFQMGIIRFEEILSLSGVSAWIGWIIVILLMVILVIAIIFSGVFRSKK